MRDLSFSTDPEVLRGDQYRDGSNLSARARLHERFSTNPYPWFRWVFEQLDIPEAARVLEIGCGTGALWAGNLDRLPSGWQVTLSDFSAGMLAEARRALAPSGRAFSTIVADAQSLPYPAGRFDAVVANHMLYHVPDVDRALAEFRRVLVPGGRLYAATNGVGHLGELWALLAEFAGRPTTDSRLARRFGLENGPELQGRHFASVELRRRANELVVTEAEPLVDYAFSVASRVEDTSDARARFRKFVEARVARDDTVRITPQTGLFVARG
jgi:SAM-dependent methyltransferase